MSGPWMALAAIAAIALLYVMVPVATEVFFRYRGRHTVRCPETGTDAEVEIDAAHAALTAVPGPPRLRIAACSFWPERGDCAQRCMVAR